MLVLKIYYEQHKIASLIMIVFMKGALTEKIYKIQDMR